MQPRYTAVLVLLAHSAAAAPTTQVVFNFKHVIGSHPEAGLLERANYYFGGFQSGGTDGCYSNGPASCGTVTRLAPPDAQHSTWHAKLIYRFQSQNDGSVPLDSPVPFGRGNLILTTSGGCGGNNTGALIELFPPLTAGAAWTDKILHQFSTANDILCPAGSPHTDGKGNVFVSATFGGKYGYGGVAMFSPPQSGQGGWTETIIQSFNGSDGGQPNGGMLSDVAGNLFVTSSLGLDNGGSVIELSPAANGTAWTETVLHVFKGGPGPDGSAPSNGLIRDASGNYYGSTLVGGPAGVGTVYELSPPASGGTQWTEQVLYSFTDGADGRNPSRGLARDAAGNLFVTTSAGGDPTCQCGTIVKLTPPTSGQGPYTETTLHTLTGAPDGAYASGLNVEDNGNLLVTTFRGGSDDKGALLEITGAGFVQK